MLTRHSRKVRHYYRVVLIYVPYKPDAYPERHAERHAVTDLQDLIKPVQPFIHPAERQDRCQSHFHANRCFGRYKTDHIFSPPPLLPPHFESL